MKLNLERLRNDLIDMHEIKGIPYSEITRESRVHNISRIISGDISPTAESWWKLRNSFPENISEPVYLNGQALFKSLDNMEDINEFMMEYFPKIFPDAAKQKISWPNLKAQTLQPHIGMHRIPLISWVHAGDWQDAEDPFQPGHADEWINTVETTSPTAFALVVHGDSMSHEFSEGDIITIDPDRSAANGSYIIAKNGDEATFKQLVLDGNNVFLKPLNDRYPIKDMTGVEFNIVGVVVEKRKKY